MLQPATPRPQEHGLAPLSLGVPMPVQAAGLRHQDSGTRTSAAGLEHGAAGTATRSGVAQLVHGYRRGAAGPAGELGLASRCCPTRARLGRAGSKPGPSPSLLALNHRDRRRNRRQRRAALPRAGSSQGIQKTGSDVSSDL